MKTFIAGMTVWLVGYYVLTEMLQFDNWSITWGYTLGLLAGFIMLEVSERG